MSNANPDVIVIGAGIAGLSAARCLADAGLRVLILEAQQRAGGRILTRREGDEVIELGAEFIHGRAPELWALIAEAGLATYERTGAFLQSGEGGLTPSEETRSGEQDPLEQLKSFPGPDCPFAEYLERFDLDAHARAEQLGYVEGFNAADARRASSMALGRQELAEDAIQGDRSWRLSAGYDQLPEFLRRKFIEAGGSLIFGSRVQQIAWSRGEVSVLDGQGNRFEAPKAIVAVPLGVLQGADIEFRPVPVTLKQSLTRMRMGSAFRCTFIFKRRLWPENMSFLLTRDLLPSIWWTAHPAPSLSLTGWVGGPRAVSLLALPAQELKTAVLIALAKALQVGPEEIAAGLTSFHNYDWQADEASRGAYSWVPVGGLDASEVLSRPVENTLFFAGEHTDTTGHWGTVHAALRSGLRAASQALAG